ncbi:MAG: cytochrome c oxidase subunit 3 [Gemmataceae bacterium]
MSAATHVESGSGYQPGHHFDNVGQQQSAVKIGMWMFLVTEVLFFGGIFCAYTVYRIWFPKDFEAGSAALNPALAVINTFLLLTSSLTITFAIRACFDRKRAALSNWLALTFILGALFLVLKSYEYYTDYKEGLIPTTKTVTETYERLNTQGDKYFEYHEVGVFEKNLFKVLHHKNYDVTGVNSFRVQIFFMLYYCMTGLHVLHMVIGLGLLLWQFILAKIGYFDYAERYVYIEVMSLYWHFVDIIWMFLLPLLYFAGPHGLGEFSDLFSGGAH